MNSLRNFYSAIQYEHFIYSIMDYLYTQNLICRVKEVCI